MKRFIIMLLTTLLALSLVSCSETAEKASERKTQPTENVTEEKAQPTEDAAEEKAQPTEDAANTVKEKEPKKTDTLQNIFERAEGEYYFSSGAGGWGTELELDDDGEFDGEYHDSELGSFTDEYPDGTIYFCEFEGRFEVVEKLNDYSYSLSLANIGLENNPNTEEIRDKKRYVYAEPYGLEGEEFILYSPETPVSEIPQSCIDWYGMRSKLKERETLNTWCIYDPENENAFYMYE